MSATMTRQQRFWLLTRARGGGGQPTAATLSLNFLTRSRSSPQTLELDLRRDTYRAGPPVQVVGAFAGRVGQPQGLLWLGLDFRTPSYTIAARIR